jgi:hypothetical protein
MRGLTTDLDDDLDRAIAAVMSKGSEPQEADRD